MIPPKIRIKKGEQFASILFDPYLRGNRKGSCRYNQHYIKQHG